MQDLLDLLNQVSQGQQESSSILSIPSDYDLDHDWFNDFLSSTPSSPNFQTLTTTKMETTSTGLDTTKNNHDGPTTIFDHELHDTVHHSSAYHIEATTSSYPLSNDPFNLEIATKVVKDVENEVVEVTESTLTEQVTSESFFKIFPISKQ